MVQETDSKRPEQLSERLQWQSPEFPALADVSVVVPTRDRGSQLVATLESCTGADGLNLELIVVDDGSEDDTRRVVSSLGKTWVTRRGLRLAYIYQPHRGACEARNRGLAVASGRYVKFLDSDDRLVADALPCEVAAADEHGVDAVLTAWMVEHPARGDAPVREPVAAPLLGHGIDDMLLGIAPWTSAALYRHQFIQEKTLRWDPEWTKAQDWGWALRVCLAGARFFTVDLVSSVYVQHPGARVSSYGNAVRRSVNARQSILRMVERTLRDGDRLNALRRQRLAAYYLRDAFYLASHDRAAWHDTWMRCRVLCPGSMPRPAGHPAGRLLVAILGVYRGALAFAALRRLLRRD